MDPEQRRLGGKGAQHLGGVSFVGISAGKREQLEGASIRQDNFLTGHVCIQWDEVFARYESKDDPQRPNQLGRKKNYV